MEVRHDHSLERANTLGFPALARHYVDVADEGTLADAVALARRERWPILILGGGSNVVLTGDVPGLVVRQRDTRIERDGNLVTAGAGIDWDALVSHTLALGLGGLENLALIPGSVGAAPVQNIGAYGVEIAERIVRVRALHLASGEWHELSRDECRFGYRDSLFRREPGRYAISSLMLRLNATTRDPVVAYASLEQELERRGIERPDAHEVAEAVRAIRRSKLPDPARIGNVGSFFKNPLVTRDHALELGRELSDLVAHPQDDGRVKLAAGQLIDSLGYRGVTRGAVGVHERQALVLVNRGGGTAAELLALAEEIAEAVAEHYGVRLEPEPTII